MASDGGDGVSGDGDGYNPLSADVRAEPSVAYRHLHESAPVHFFEDFEPPFYTLSRFADVQTALLDIETYSSEWGQGPRFSPPRGMLSNPPQHTFYRRLVQKAFTPKAIAEQADRITALSAELLDQRADPQKWDLHDDYAFPLPVIVIVEMLGVPGDDLQRFKHWSDITVEAMGAEDPAPWEGEMVELASYLLNVIRQRRADPQDDLVSGLVTAEQDGKGLTDDEVLSVVNQLFVGGNETTTSLITNMVWRLLSDRALWERLVEDPGLVDAAVEESLRFDPPVLGLYRSTTRDVEMEGGAIPKDAKVMMHYAAANRDPEAFESPDAFSLDRERNRHLAFGMGVHFCLGAPLARLEARVALRTLLQRCPDLRLLGDGERIAPFFLWGRRRLPVSG